MRRAHAGLVFTHTLGRRAKQAEDEVRVGDGGLMVEETDSARITRLLVRLPD
jgi:hypothetical protein